MCLDRILDMSWFASFYWKLSYLMLLIWAWNTHENCQLRLLLMVINFNHRESAMATETRIQTQKENDVYSFPDSRTGKRVPIQSVLDKRETKRVVEHFKSVRKADQNLVPKSTYEIKESSKLIEDWVGQWTQVLGYNASPNICSYKQTRIWAYTANAAYKF